MECCDPRGAPYWACVRYPPAPAPAHRYDYADHYRAHYDHRAPHVPAPAPLEYGPYASKEARVRRTLARREVRGRTQHIPLPSTPPLDCGRGGYYEPHMWSHYQNGMMRVGAWNNMAGFGWNRGSGFPCAREHMRTVHDVPRPAKASPLHVHNQMYPSSYMHYEDPHYTERASVTPECAPAQPAPPAPPEVVVVKRERPPVVPLPAFQQAFGSTEIGRFAEAFSRAELLTDENSSVPFDEFSEWETSEPPYCGPPARRIKCEDAP